MALLPKDASALLGKLVEAFQGMAKAAESSNEALSETGAAFNALGSAISDGIDVPTQSTFLPQGQPYIADSVMPKVKQASTFNETPKYGLKTGYLGSGHVHNVSAFSPGFDIEHDIEEIVKKALIEKKQKERKDQPPAFVEPPSPVGKRKIDLDE